MQYFLKYTVEYENISGDDFLLEIFKLQEFAPGEQAPLKGSVTYEKKPTRDTFDPLRGTSLGINLEASNTNLLLDFSGFQEFDFKVKFYRNGLQEFEGWINPDGYFQDWVNDVWEISMTAVDGLGGLKNLEFLNGENGQTQTFNLFHTFLSGNTVLQLELRNGDNWIDFGFENNTYIEILSGVNEGEYFVTNISGSILTANLITFNGSAFFNGPFSCEVQWGFFRYAPREFNYLHAILKRLGYELPYTIGDDINVSLGVPVDWIDYDKRIIDATVFTNENGNKLDCETVLKDILQKYNLFITQNNIDGRLVWHICRVPYWGLPLSARRNRQYTTVLDTSGGSDVVEVELTQFAFAEEIPKNVTIYSDVNSGMVDPPRPIHCNENQQITYFPALQNFRFQSKWLGNRSFLGTIEESWSEIPPLPAYPTASDQWGIFDNYIKMFQVFTGDLINDPWFASEFIRPPSTIEIGVAFGVDWWIDYNFVNPAVEVPAETRMRFLLEYKTDTYTRYFNENTGEWQSAVHLIEILGVWPTPGAQPVGVVTGRGEIVAPPGGKDVTGEYRISVYSPYEDNTGYHEVRLLNVDFQFQTSQFGIGKTHDAIQPDLRSTYLKEPVDIINSNEPNAYFKNNLYRLAKPPETITGLVPMNEWKATGTPEYDDLLELTSRERVKAKQKAQLTFRGDVFGYVPYVSVIRYDGIAGNYIPLSYNYNTVDNVIEMEVTQIFNTEAVINHEKKYIFEEEKNALIKK